MSSAKPVDIVLVQVYMPTTNHDDDKIEKLYEEISEILYQEGRGQVNAIVMGDFNSIVGEGSTDVVLVQVYMPTTNHDDDEIEQLYEEISEILHQEGRGQVNSIVMGDFNSIVGEEFTDKVVERFGLGRKNERQDAH